jgi:hypothetical protein
MPEQADVQSHAAAQVWKDAHVRRTEDISIWLKQFFQRLPEAERQDGNFAAPRRVVAAS